MGIERTDEWLEKDFFHPHTLCRKMLASQEEEPARLYHYLLRFGMYRPGRRANDTYQTLRKKKVWQKAESIFAHYQRLWEGPDVPVFILPKSEWRDEMDPVKSGVSFHDRIFLFLGEFEDEKELEALLIHEYHHVCRLTGLQKPMEEYTLLDSMAMEGFAEYAVRKYCGSDYNAEWTSFYPPEKLSHYWTTFVKEMIHIKRSHPLHDRLLYGLGRYPKLLGYALGFHIIMLQKERETWTPQDTFSLQAEEMSFPS